MTPRILVVDNDAEQVDLLCAVLKREGYDVEGVTSGVAALEALAAAEPAVVLTDLRMDGMDGLALLREVRERAPGARVILMTAFGSLETAIEAIRQAEGTSMVVGVNRYANEGDVSIPVLEVDPALEEEQRRRLAVWRAGRDQGSVEAALADLGDQAKTSGNLLYPIKEALRVGATVGEVSNRLREVFGVYRPG